MIKLFLKGILMGAADVVPGVSGGTVALILGIYEKLIAEISHIKPSLLLKFKFKEFFSIIDFKFLMTLFSGVLFSVLIFSRVIHYLLQTYPHYVFACFLGFIFGSIFILLKSYSLWKRWYLGLFLISSIASYFLLSQFQIVFPKSLPYIFASGFLASSAMILPGISGSYILVVLGMYQFIISHLKSLASMDSLQIILIFCLGVASGILLMSKLLKKLFTWNPDLILSILLGFVLGGVGKIWPWGFRAESLRLPRLSNAFDLKLLLIVFSFSIVIILIDYQSRKS